MGGLPKHGWVNDGAVGGTTTDENVAGCRKRLHGTILGNAAGGKIKMKVLQASAKCCIGGFFRMRSTEFEWASPGRRGGHAEGLRWCSDCVNRIHDLVYTIYGRVPKIYIWGGIVSEKLVQGRTSGAAGARKLLPSDRLGRGGVT